MVDSDIVASVGGIIISYFTYIYLRGLTNCSCVQQIYASRLSYFEVFLIGFNGLILVLSLLTTFNIVNSKSLTNFKLPLFNILIITSLILLFMNIYLIYNTYYFSATMGKNCICADKWQKYYIYYQGISSAFMLVFSFFYAGYAGYIGYNKVPVSMKYF